MSRQEEYYREILNGIFLFSLSLSLFNESEDPIVNLELVYVYDEVYMHILKWLF